MNNWYINFLLYIIYAFQNRYSDYMSAEPEIYIQE